MKVEQLITDEALEVAWGNADFGPNTNKRDVIRYTLLKTACGYASGHTADCIVNELGLKHSFGKLTELGKRYLYEAFRDGSNL